MFRTRRRRTLLFAFGTILSVVLGDKRSAQGGGDGDPWILMHAQVVNIPREQNADVADYHEVYEESLSELPIIVLIGLGTRPQVDLVPLAEGRRRWNGEIDFQVERDGEVLDNNWLEPLYPEMGISPDEGRRGDWTTSRRSPSQLRQGEGAQAFFAVTGTEGTRLSAGNYVLSIRWKDSAQAFFGIRASPSGDIVFRVKKKESGEEDRYTEDLVERHYLWACWLYKFDRVASKKEFEKAWALVQEYLKSGAGDEPGYWNATPRHQAGAIAGWLDRPKDAIRYGQELAAKNQLAKNGQLKLNMRYYHFGPAKDQLPRNYADELLIGLNRAYERTYGKTMSGRELPPMPPVEKHFTDDTE